MIGKIVYEVLSDNSARRIHVTDSAAEKAEKGDKAEKPAPKKRAPRKKKAAEAITSLEQIVCPSCGKGHILKGRTAYGCSNFASGCAFSLPFEQYPPRCRPQNWLQTLSPSKHTVRNFVRRLRLLK